MEAFFRRRRRQQLAAAPFPDEWRKWIERNVAVYRLLPPPLAERLLKTTRIIVAERRFVGCKGLVVTEEMKVTLAAQASLLLLGEEGYYFDRVTSFLLYPYKMILPSQSRAPAEDQQPDDHIILGQAFKQGEIIFSWPDVLAGGRDAADGENVVLHELAHHLDGLDGEMGGTPPGVSSSQLDQWHRVLERELDLLRRDLAEGQPTLLAAAAAENAGEVFAYGTELFFEQPRLLREESPELFDCYRSFYKLDPSQWFGKESLLAEEQDVDDGSGDSSYVDRPTVELPPLEAADQYFTRGFEWFSAGHFQLAADDFNRCVRLAPDDQEALLYRSRSFLFLGHAEAALADADRACRLDARDKESLCQRAICRAELGRYEEALEDFDRATDSSTEDVQTLFFRGLSRAESGRLELAVLDFSSVIRHDPEDAEAWHERGRCLKQLGQLKQAEQDFAQARKLGWSEN